MDILLVILACLCFLVGLAGCIVPLIPGPPISYIGLLLLQWSGFAGFSVNFLLVMAVITVMVTAMDFYLPVWMTKRFGGSRAATVGSAIGLIAGIFVFPPLGIIICPFIGALIGELINDHANSSKAFKVAMGAFASFLVGTGLKLILCGVILYYGFAALF